MGAPINFEPQPGVYFTAPATVTQNQNGSYTVTPANGPTTGGTPRVSQGNYQTLPTPTTNGAELPSRPAYTSGFMLHMPAGSTIQGFKAATGTAPTGPANGNQIRYAPVVDMEQPVYLSGTDSFFVTAATNGTGTGSPVILFDWVQK